MSLFKNKKEEKEVSKAPVKTAKKLAVPAVKAESSSEAISHFGGAERHIIRPRVTEKSSALSAGDRTVLVFEVSSRANKKSVALSVKEMLKVMPEKVSILKIPPKSGYSKGKRYNGKTGYKAYVYFKKGEKLEI